MSGSEIVCHTVGSCELRGLGLRGQGNVMKGEGGRGGREEARGRLLYVLSIFRLQLYSILKSDW